MTSTAGLVPGMWITVSNPPMATAVDGTNYDGGESHKIRSIVGNTITIDSNWGVTIAGGTVYTSGTWVTLNGNLARVQDLIINGNSANWS